MSRLELITDSDISEVAESAETFDSLKEATAPLGALFDLIQAERLMNIFDAAPRRRPTQARPTTRKKQTDYDRAFALSNVFDGTFGHLIDIAQGKVSILSQEREQAADLFPAERPEQAPLFAQTALDPQHRRLGQSLVDEALALAQAHRFLHWELAFPNVWKNWLSPHPAGGFDAVIGNPPYVRQEQIQNLKPGLKKAYKTFNGMADLYVYFYELGLWLLRPGGRLSYVVTNKWLRAGYAEELRGFLSSESWLEAVADFGHAKKFFPSADVFPCVVVVRRPAGSGAPDEAEVCQIPRDVVRLDRVSQDVSDKAFPLPRASFTKQGWHLDPPEVAALMDKIRRAGVPLKEYAGVSPQYGIKTALNEAFLIDTPTRDALVAADPKCAEIIKPYVRGQDIERWYAPWRDLWMIVIKSSSDYPWPWADAGLGAERILQATFPELLFHFKAYEHKLRERQDQGRYWWEFRPCTYYTDFEKPKVVLKEITWRLEWAWDEAGHYVNNTAYIVSCDNRWLPAAANSPLIWWYAWRSAIHGKDEALRFIREYVEGLPIAQPSQSLQPQATEIVNQLISRKKDLAETFALLRDWYTVEMSIVKPNKLLLEPFALTSDQFVDRIRRGRGIQRPLSAAGVQAVRDEYARTVRPMQAALREAERLEWHLSDLVNEACGLTPDEIHLMWATAPPRMPLAPDAGALEQDGGEAAE